MVREKCQALLHVSWAMWVMPTSPIGWQARTWSEKSNWIDGDEGDPIAKPDFRWGMSATSAGTPGQMGVEPSGIELPGSRGGPWPMVSPRDAEPNTIGEIAANAIHRAHRMLMRRSS